LEHKQQQADLEGAHWEHLGEADISLWDGFLAPTCKKSQMTSSHLFGQVPHFSVHQTKPAQLYKPHASSKIQSTRFWNLIKQFKIL
jgi:hypothetical protein